MNYKSNKNQENKDYEMLEKTELDVNFYENKNRRINKIKSIQKKSKYSKITNKKTSEIIAISGYFGTGKTIISSLLSKYISFQNKKVLLIDFNLENEALNVLFGVKKYKEKNNKFDIENYILNINKNLNIITGISDLFKFNINYSLENFKLNLRKLKTKYDYIIFDTSSRIDLKYVKLVLANSNKIIFLIEPNLLEIAKANSMIEVILKDWNINIDKIKIVFNKANKNKVIDSIVEEIFSEFEILGNIKYNEEYNLFINKNTNIEINYTEINEIYSKIKKEERYANSSVRSY